MRILLTGCTNIQALKRRRQRYTYVLLYDMLHDCLTEAGHEVDWRPVVPGEDLKGRYDVALVGVAALNGFLTMTHKWGALWAASQLPHAVVFDDWQVKGICGSIRIQSTLWAMGVVDAAMHAKAMPHRAEIERVRAEWASSMRHVIAPLFNWGDRAIFHENHRMENLWTWDPSPHIPFPDLRHDGYERFDHKERRWACAALANKDAWLARYDFKWPVERRFKGGLPRLKTETEIVLDCYAPAWGVLSPAVPGLDGSGWWRARFNFAAHVGSVLWGEAAELAPLSPAYWYPLERLEGLSDEGLRDVALQQASWLHDQELSHERSIATLDGIVRTVAAEG